MEFNPNEWQGRTKQQVDTAHALAFTSVILGAMILIMCVITKFL